MFLLKKYIYINYINILFPFIFISCAKIDFLFEVSIEKKSRVENGGEKIFKLISFDLSFICKLYRL